MELNIKRLIHDELKQNEKNKYCIWSAISISSVLEIQ